MFKDQDKDKDFSSKDKDNWGLQQQGQGQGLVKDKDQDKDCILVLKESLRTGTRTNITANEIVDFIYECSSIWTQSCETSCCQLFTNLLFAKIDVEKIN